MSKKSITWIIAFVLCVVIARTLSYFIPWPAPASKDHPVIADTAGPPTFPAKHIRCDTAYTMHDWAVIHHQPTWEHYGEGVDTMRVRGGLLYRMQNRVVFVPDPPKPAKPCECEPYRVYPFHPIDPGICPVPDLPKWKDHLMLQDTISLQNLRGLHLYDTINGRSNLWIIKDTIK